MWRTSRSLPPLCSESCYNETNHWARCADGICVPTATVCQARCRSPCMLSAPKVRLPSKQRLRLPYNTYMPFYPSNSLRQSSSLPTWELAKEAVSQIRQGSTLLKSALQNVKRPQLRLRQVQNSKRRSCLLSEELLLELAMFRLLGSQSRRESSGKSTVKLSALKAASHLGK